MRLDRFLSRWFRDRSRSELARAIKAGQVTDDTDRPLRASSKVRSGQQLRITIPGIAPTTPPPPMPQVLYEDEHLVALDKPPGLPVHPGGTKFTWAVIGLARERWPGIDLVHRLDRDTSGVLLLAKDQKTNAGVKEELKAGRVFKEYEALCRGDAPFEHTTIDAPIGPAQGPIRIQMAVRDDGLAARTTVEVIARNASGQPPMTWVRCRIHTGRTHQIRVHLDHVGASLIGDRLYGVGPEVFLRAWEHGVDDTVIAAAGAPRHALHARRIRLRHPAGHSLEIEAPWPADLDRWWTNPSVLPFDRQE
jgi:23S rRNA pseudouridine1911/1915/1917 synthase